MFHPSAGGAPFTAVSGLSGDRCWRPGGHDAQPDPGHHVSEYALDDDGRVLLPDPSLPGPRFVNSSLIAFPDSLDPPAFAMDTWWDRVHEEVGLDVIRPAPPGPAAAPRARPHDRTACRPGRGTR
ncbi:hypothetical protein [Streptomyces atrovirens]|uniref:Uncharacterized protein n=1 Tax=Streptomyces atrovirens TaxID=285556 RepID=A0ABW0E0M2_9ACTN